MTSTSLYGLILQVGNTRLLNVSLFKSRFMHTKREKSPVIACKIPSTFLLVPNDYSIRKQTLLGHIASLFPTKLNIV